MMSNITLVSRDLAKAGRDLTEATDHQSTPARPHEHRALPDSLHEVRSVCQPCHAQAASRGGHQRVKPQLHVGTITPTADGFKPVTNRPGGWHKPLGGMWTSTYDPIFGSGWVQWCLGEDWGVPSNGWHAWLLRPDPAARVLVIDSYGDLQRLCAQYAADTCRGVFCDLNYEAMAREFDAVRLTERGQWRTRLSHPHSLYGWDCESTVWLRWAFVSIEALGLCTWPLRDANLVNEDVNA